MRWKPFPLRPCVAFASTRDCSAAGSRARIRPRYISETSVAGAFSHPLSKSTVAPSTDTDARDNAAFQVALHSIDRTRIPSLRTDLLSKTAALQAGVLAATLGELVTVTGLPHQAPRPTTPTSARAEHAPAGAHDRHLAT